MSGPNAENPFDVNPTPIDFSPTVTTAQLDALQQAITAGSVKPEDAEKAKAAIEKAIQEKKSASEILSTVVGIVKGVAGILK